MKSHQKLYGESEFNWNKSTDEIIHAVLESLSSYISAGESKDMVAQLPKELKEFFIESLHLQ